MFPCEYCKIFKNSFFYKTPPEAAFDCQRIWLLNTWKLKVGTLMQWLQLDSNPEPLSS